MSAAGVRLLCGSEGQGGAWLPGNSTTTTSSWPLAPAAGADAVLASAMLSGQSAPTLQQGLLACSRQQEEQDVASAPGLRNRAVTGYGDITELFPMIHFFVRCQACHCIFPYTFFLHVRCGYDNLSGPCLA